MPKKKKRKKKPSVPVAARSLMDLVKSEGQEYAKVTTLLGNRRVTLDRINIFSDFTLCT